MDIRLPPVYQGYIPGMNSDGVFDTVLERGRTPGTGAFYESSKRARFEQVTRSDPDDVMNGITSWPRDGMGYTDFKRNVNTRMSYKINDIGSRLTPNAFHNDQLVFVQSSDYLRKSGVRVQYDNPGLGFERRPVTNDESGFEPYHRLDDFDFNGIGNFSVLNLSSINFLLQSELKGTATENLTAQQTLDDLCAALGGPVNNVSNGKSTPWNQYHGAEPETVSIQHVSLEGDVPVVSIWDLSQIEEPLNHVQLYGVLRRVHHNDRHKFGLGSYFNVNPGELMQFPVRPMNDKWVEDPYQFVSFPSVDGVPPISFTEYRHDGEWFEGKVYGFGNILYEQTSSVMANCCATLYDVSTVPSAARLHVNWKDNEIAFAG